MFPNSTMLDPLFWIAMGLLYALVFAGARAWAQDLKLSMPWWKWLLAIGWFFALNISVAGGFTLFGENERQAGLYFLMVFGTFSLLSGVGLWRVLVAGRERKT